MGGCKGQESSHPSLDEYSPDIAYAWLNMQRRLLNGTPGILPHTAGRTYAYVGLTLYESLVPGMDSCQSIGPQLNGGLQLPQPENGKSYFWPASANAAVASILRGLLPHALPAHATSIDSLESLYHDLFMLEADPATLNRSVEFGKAIAAAVFEWSLKDGAQDAYKSPFADDYVPPTGPGKWVSTGEFPFDQPVYPYWGSVRSFVKGSAEATQPSPPPTYSEMPGSPFYEAVNEIYMMSQHLTHEDSVVAKFWAYQPLDPERPLPFEGTGHAANIAVQAMRRNSYSLEDAAVLICKHAMAGHEAGISCVKTKFTHNLVRPITYIRNVMRHKQWKPVIPTPPFPEYTSGHAAVSMAYAAILEDEFGEKYSFTDHTFDDTFGPREFESFEAYATEAALSRLKGGIHYRFAMDEGLKQGRKVASKVLELKFNKP
jgi:hypothetical protein